MARDETHFYTTIKTCIMGFLHGQPPQVAIEFGRKSTPGAAASELQGPRSAAARKKA